MSRDLLPWFVNGTLGADDRAAVLRTLDESAEARADLELWRAVAAEIEHEEIAPNAGGVDLGWLRLERQLNVPASRAPTRGWSWAAAAALVVLLGGQTLYMVRTQRAQDEQIRELSAAPVALRADEWGVQVRFRADATVGEINSLLLDLDARVIGGPSALGIYEIAVPRSARFADAQAVARWLSEQPIVEQGSAPP